MSSNEEDQADELIALSSIYEEPVFTAGEDQKGGQFLINVQLPENFQIRIDGHVVSHVLKTGLKPVESNGRSVLPITFMPPIMLHFQYPSDYPSCCAPKFTLSSKWLSPYQLSQLCSELDSLWEENHGSVILFMWIQFLQEESFSFLNLDCPLSLDYSYIQKFRRQASKNVPSRNEHDNPAINSRTTYAKSEPEGARHGDGASVFASLDSRAIQDVASMGNLISSIIYHNEEEKENAFNAAFYHCQICFDKKLGMDCTSFQNCRHVYCKECIGEYFRVQISDGNVKGLACPQDKCDSQAAPSQVKALVSEELFSRYDRLLLQFSLEGMEDIINCPRIACSCPVIKEEDSNMAVCTACRFAFCTLCNMAYHGISHCRLKKDDLKKLRNEYEKGDDATREALDKKYGRRMIKRLLEDSCSEQWVQKHSRKCPSCGSNIQKIDGCNKMACSKCHTYFCWLCMAVLSKANPYAHFREMTSRCYNLLFQGIQVMDAGDEEDILGGGEGDDGIMWLNVDDLLQFL